jgi:nickel superoxide dismutase
MFSGLLVTSTAATEPANPISKIASPPHCQVPCGIYTDQLRFEQMLEDTKTIAKSIASVGELTANLESIDATGVNQLTRWINTKEDHASSIQKVVAEYFLTQRIKDSNKDYASQLMAAHKVMVSAMKCKQAADPATAETLKKSILDLYRSYEGKEPNFDHKEK